MSRKILRGPDDPDREALPPWEEIKRFHRPWGEDEHTCKTCEYNVRCYDPCDEAIANHYARLRKREAWLEADLRESGRRYLHVLPTWRQERCPTCPVGTEYCKYNAHDVRLGRREDKHCSHVKQLLEYERLQKKVVEAKAEYAIEVENARSAQARRLYLNVVDHPGDRWTVDGFWSGEWCDNCPLGGRHCTTISEPCARTLVIRAAQAARPNDRIWAEKVVAMKSDVEEFWRVHRKFPPLDWDGASLYGDVEKRAWT